MAGVVVVGNTLTLPGYPEGQVFTPDGTRAVLTSNPNGSLQTYVAVVDTATGSQVGTTYFLSGIPQGDPLLNADGTRAVITAHGWDTQVMVIDTATGQQVGPILTLAGENGIPTVLSSDGTRAVITTTSTDLVSGGTRVAVIDTATGAQIGTTLTFPGTQSATWSADATHALITTSVTDPASYTVLNTLVRVIDTTTGAQTGTTLTLPGQAGGPLLGAGGTRALMTTSGEDSSGPVTQMAVIDTTTGTQISTLTLAGSISSAVMSADGGHALITTRVDDPVTHAPSTLVTLIDATTGTQTGTTVPLAGAQWSAPKTADATHAVITTYIPDGYNVLNTQVSVIDTTTGALTGSTITLPGREMGNLLLSADGTRALIANDAGAAVIVDTTTGTRTGPSFTLSGVPYKFDLVSTDGTRALITTWTDQLGDPLTNTTQVSVIDATTGTQIGTTLSVAGSGAPLLSADGTHALIIVSAVDPLALTDPYFARLAVIDTTTGDQTGVTSTLPGPITGAQLLGDGTRVLITASSWNGYTGTGSTRMSVINTATGNQVGGSVTLPWGGEVAPFFSADGTHILITPIFGDWLGPEPTVNTRVAILEVV